MGICDWLHLIIWQLYTSKQKNMSRRFIKQRVFWMRHLIKKHCFAEELHTEKQINYTKHWKIYREHRDQWVCKAVMLQSTENYLWYNSNYKSNRIAINEYKYLQNILAHTLGL